MKDLNRQFEDIESAVQRYVVGRMTNSEAEDFEAYFLNKPELIEQIEIVQNMHVGLANEQQSFDSVVAAKGTSGKTAFQKLLGWLTIPVPAFAVLAIAAIISPVVLNGLSSASSEQNIELLSFSTTATRSAKQQPSIDLSNIEGRAALMVKVKSVTHPFYKLKLVRESSNDIVWTSNAFQVGSLRDYLVTVPQDLNGSKYGLRLVGVSVDSIESPVEFCNYSEMCN